MSTLYKDFAPTGFDFRGLGLENRQDWIVAPCSRSRDSDTLTESNFASAKRMLTDLPEHQESEDGLVEVHRFGHWACGWFEIILVHPSLAEHVESIESALANYPVLDDQDHSEREHEAEWEAWQSWGHTEYLRKHLAPTFDLSESTLYWFLDVPSYEQTFALYNEHTPYTEHHSDGPSFAYKQACDAESFTRSKLAQWIRDVRKAHRETKQA